MVVSTQQNLDHRDKSSKIKNILRIKWKFKPANLLDLASDLLNRITARRSLNVYRIANARGQVGSFCINKTSYKLGEDIVAGFDFTEGTVPCLQISVCLQAEEQVADEYRKRQIHNHVTR